MNLSGGGAARVGVGVLALALLVVGVVIVTQRDGEEARPGDDLPTFEERAQMTPEERALLHLDTLPDGEHQGRLLTIDDATVTFRLVRVLSGQEAVEAARAEGRLAEGDTLPNDYYIQDTHETRTLPLGEGAGFRVMDCTNGCQEVDTSREVMIGAEGGPYGGGNAVFVFQMAGGRVVALAEVYLP